MLKLLHRKTARKQTADVEEDGDLNDKNIPNPEHRVQDTVSQT